MDFIPMPDIDIENLKYFILTNNINFKGLPDNIDKIDVRNKHDIKLTFGKYKDYYISQVPRNYLKWLSQNTYDDKIRKIANYFL
jgi:hypothetical protein